MLELMIEALKQSIASYGKPRVLLGDGSIIVRSLKEGRFVADHFYVGYVKHVESAEDFGTFTFDATTSTIYYEYAIAIEALTQAALIVGKGE